MLPIISERLDIAVLPLDVSHLTLLSNTVLYYNLLICNYFECNGDLIFTEPFQCYQERHPETIIPFPCPFLIKPHPCLVILLLS